MSLLHRSLHNSKVLCGQEWFATYILSGYLYKSTGRFVFGQVLIQCRWQLTASPRLDPTSFADMGLPEEAVKKPSIVTLDSHVVKLIRIERPMGSKCC